MIGGTNDMIKLNRKKIKFLCYKGYDNSNICFLGVATWQLQQTAENPGWSRQNVNFENGGILRKNEGMFKTLSQNLASCETDVGRFDQCCQS